MKIKSLSASLVGISLILGMVILPVDVSGGPIAGAICSAGCAAVVMACYSAAGAIWGATAGLGAPPAVLACNAAFGVCMAKCYIATAAPIP